MSARRPWPTMTLGAALPGLSQGVDSTKWFVTQGRISKRTAHVDAWRPPTLSFPATPPCTCELPDTPSRAYRQGAARQRTSPIPDSAIWMVGKACIDDLIVIPSPEWVTSPELTLASTRPVSTRISLPCGKTPRILTGNGRTTAPSFLVIGNGGVDDALSGPITESELPIECWWTMRGFAANPQRRAAPQMPDPSRIIFARIPDCAP
jgi:hypothetical protein